MLILSATICLLRDPLTVQCETRALRVEMDPVECLAMLAPVEVMLREQADGLPVAYIKAACKRGIVG